MAVSFYILSDFVCI